MKIFLDTANLDEIKKAVELGVVDGVTTNPTLLSREVERTGRKPNEILYEICEIVKGPVSAEVLSLDAEGMVKDAMEVSKIHKNIYVKIPVTMDGIKAMKILREKNININATLVFSINQALLCAKAGANFISPFIGRLDDIGHDGMKLVEEIVRMINNYNFESKVLVASVRHPMHVAMATQIGAHICTVPYKVFEFLFKHPLTDIGIKRFMDDWLKVKEIIK